MTLIEAADVFGYGFTYTRSFTHPYVHSELGPLRIMRNDPPRPRDPRNEEIISVGVDPATTLAVVRQYAAKKFALCVLHGINEPEATLIAAYKAGGFRLNHREAMMVMRIEELRPLDQPVEIRRVTTEAEAAAVAKAARSRQILPDQFGDDAPLRLYAAWDQDEVVGWVRSIAGPHKAAWVSNMFVRLDHRRKGIGSALMTRLLEGDSERGIAWSVLLASNAGAQLYPHIGYRKIGQLLIFTPRKS